MAKARPNTAGRKLAYTVYLPNPTKNGQTIGIGPDDDVPSWADGQIGPHAFEGYNPETGGFDDDGEAPEGPPPLTGKGSGDKAWRDYAARDDIAEQLEAAGESVADDAKRDDVVAALERAGIATE